MESYIKSYKTFHTTRQCKTTDYSLILDSLDSKASSITVDGDDIPRTVNGSWLILNGIPMWITRVTPGKGLTKLTLGAAEEIFNRQLLADFNEERTEPEWPDSTVGGLIERIINREWVNQEDLAYATPYISVDNNDNTPFFPPETDTNGIWNLLAYIRTARLNYNIRLIWSVERDGLRITITRENAQIHPLVLDDGHTQLASSAFESSTVAKITVVQPVEIPVPEGEEPDEDGPQFEMTETDWYLKTDGTVTTALPTNRAEGEWITIVIGEGDDQAEKVQEEIAKNGESHKIEMFSDVQMEVGDKFRIKLNTKLFEGTIIRKQIKKGDRRVLFTSGELITTIQERVNRTAAAQKLGYTGDGAGQIYAVGDIYITTREGNPAQLLGYGAWEQIQGRFLFAADGNHQAASKGGEASHTLKASELPTSVKSPPNLSSRMMTANSSGQLQYVMGDPSFGTLGQGQAIPIMPLFYAVYVWRRKE